MLIPASILVLAVLLGGCLRFLWRRPAEGLGLPLVMILVCVFEFIIQPVSALRAGALECFLSEAQFTRAILWPGVAVLCFVRGWASVLAVRPGSVADGSRVALRPRNLWGWGFGSALAGLGLEAVFIVRSGGMGQAFGQPHGAGLADAENTAYLYMGILWVYTGITMMIVARAYARLTGRKRSVPYLFAALLYARAVLTGSRGPALMTTACLLAALCFARRRPVRVRSALPVMLAAGVFALLLLGYREVLHLGEYRPEPPAVIDGLTAGVRVEPHALSRGITGFEFLYHAAILATVDATQKYHLGLNWLYVFTVHLIPRIWWPDKPYAFNTPGITLDDISAVTGLVRAGGAAPGLVADLYRNFGVLSLLFFWLLGKVTAKLYGAALQMRSELPVVAYVLLYALSFQMLGQTFQAVLAPFVYALAPLLLYKVLATMPKRASRSRCRKALSSEAVQVKWSSSPSP